MNEYLLLYTYMNRLVLDADTMPMVIPFVHTGMQEIMPVGAKIPRIGKTVSYLTSHVLINGSF